MKFLVVGCGSIGQRHLRNLQHLGIKDILIYDQNINVLRQLESRLGCAAFTTLEEALEEKPDAVIIAVPTSFHLHLAVDAARYGAHLLIEKPLSHSLELVNELKCLVKEKQLITLVGCNLRFHPSIKKIQEIVVDGKLGNIISARVEFGQYLPDWHPWEDYRKGYSAQSELGGGIILDGIHELDYLRWILGEVEEVFCFAGTSGGLEIDTEDYAEILLKFKGRYVAEVHLDYLQRTYRRTCQIIGEKGTILWDFNEKRVKFYSTKVNDWELLDEPYGYQINDMYLDEMRHFIDCIRGNNKTIQDVEEASFVLKVAMAAKESARTGKKIIISAWDG